VEDKISKQRGELLTKLKITDEDLERQEKSQMT